MQLCSASLTVTKDTFWPCDLLPLVIEMKFFEPILLSICFDHGINLTGNYLCEFCGLSYATLQGLKTHCSKTHYKPLPAMNFKTFFSEMAVLMKYPDWLTLPNRIETEICYILENFANDILLNEISIVFQTDWNAHLGIWNQFELVGLGLCT